VLAIEADVSKPKDIERLIAATLAAFGGRLDVLVNNASTLGPSPMPYLLDYPLEDFQNLLNTNFDRAVSAHEEFAPGDGRKRRLDY
jgi:NAD(P)-dependent dehydrogenase (short-subunit alcohol dehydrogenase family)